MGRLSEYVRKVSCLNDYVDLHPTYKWHCEGKNFPSAFHLFFYCDVLYVFNVEYTVPSKSIGTLKSKLLC